MEIDARLGLQQRMFPSYRRGFFELLAQSCSNGFSLFAGEPQAKEHVNSAHEFTHGTFTKANNLHLLGGKLYFCYQQNLMHWLEDWNPDVLILEANPRYLASPGAVRWMQHRNRPVIGWGLGAPQGSNPLLAGMWRRFSRQFGVVIAYSQQGKQDYIALGIPAEQIFVAPNAVLPAPANFISRDSPQGAVNVLYVGRLQARKKVDALICACAKYHAEGEKINLKIVGDGPEGESLRMLASQVFPQTVFTGALHGEAVRPYFEQADIFILPGTGGLAVQEALSYSLPVIVAEADGTQSNMVRPENGWVIDPQDENGLQKALGEALAQKDHLPGMGQVSYRIAQDEVNINRMVEVFAEAVAFAQERRKQS